MTGTALSVIFLEMFWNVTDVFVCIISGVCLRTIGHGTPPPIGSVASAGAVKGRI